VKPSIGRIVIVRGAPAASNGTDRAPAIITRVWGASGIDTKDAPVLVNTHAFRDCEVSQPVTSVKLYETEAAADASGDPTVAFWPERS
jgi:hypothetical protein